MGLANSDVLLQYEIHSKQTQIARGTIPNGGLSRVSIGMVGLATLQASIRLFAASEG